MLTNVDGNLYYTELECFDSIKTCAPSDFSLITAKDFEVLKEEISDVKKTYTLQYSDDTTTMYLKTSGEGSSGFKRCKYRGRIKASKEDCYHTIRDYKSRCKWDVRDMGRRILDVYKVDGYPINVVENLTKKGSFTVGNRDFVTLNSELWEKQKDGSTYIYLLGKSIQHPKVPVNDDFVRAEIFFVGILIEDDPKDANSCYITVVSETDPKGWIPSWVYNWALKYLPKEFELSMERGVAIRKEGSQSYKNYYAL